MEKISIDLLSQTQIFMAKGGFLSVGLVLIFLVTPFSARRSREISVGCLFAGVAFLVAFGVLNFIQSWSKRVLVYGEIVNLKSGYVASIRSNLRKSGPAFTQRDGKINQDGVEIVSFPFVLLSKEPPACISIFISKSGDEEYESNVFQIPIIDEDLYSDGALVVEFISLESQQKLKVWRERGEKKFGEILEIYPLSSGQRDCQESFSSSSASLDYMFSGVAYAQDTVDYIQLSARLQSDDPFTRRDARIDLSDRGINSFDIIEKLMKSDIYRLQLGAAIAVGDMKKNDRSQKTDFINRKLKQFISSSDPTLRIAAQKALR